MKELILSKGMIALVDDEDYERVMQFKWTATLNNGKWYAYRHIYYPGGKREKVYLHRFIMDAPKEKVIDHVNGDGLRCVRDNMRVCTRTQNQGNRVIRRNSTTGYKGVVFDKVRNKYAANMTVKGKSVHLGRYSDPVKAALAYDEAARLYFGEFAKTNF